MIEQFIILIFGFGLLIFGADLLVKGASNIAKKFHISEILIGLTIVALGTSLPELVVTIISATTGNTDIIIGNVIGSNLCNLLLILGVLAIMKPIKFEDSSIKQNMPLLNVVTLLVLIMGLGLFSKNPLTLNKFDAIILLLIAFVYFAYPIWKYMKERKKEIVQLHQESDNINIILCIIYCLIGCIALKFGGDFVVDSASNIAFLFNIPERVVSLTIVALGTSLPELATSVIAVIKGDDDIAEGNILGSCIINLCLILGVGAFFSNLILSIEFIENIILLFASCILIWLYALSNKDHTLTRLNGVILLVIYIIYCVRLFI